MKKIIVVLFLLSFTVGAIAQKKGSTSRPFVFSKRFKNSSGIGTGYYRVNEMSEYVPFINYAPQLDLTGRYSDWSLSLNTPLAAGFHIKTLNDPGNYVFADVPMLLEINIGHLASNDFLNDFGYFFGGGYSVNYFNNRLQHAPAATVGFRMWLFGKSITMRYILEGITNDPKQTTMQLFSLNINTGAYLENVKMNNKISNFMRTFDNY
jgi:hypothetical protein